MDNFALIELLQQEMRKAVCDARAEPQLALALQKGLSPDDFMVSADSLFHREYSKDVTSAEIKEDVRKRHLLQIHLSRSGIYDQLPEGLFFQSQEPPRGSFSATDMAADHKLNKKKEEEIRRFFLPFENDFFWQRLQIEREEGRLLEGLQKDILNEYFKEFWNIPDSIPGRYVVQLILLLPHAYKIAGSLSLIAQSLEHLLEEEVVVRKVSPAVVRLEGAGAPGLGNAQLGMDMVCGEQFFEDFPVIEIVVGPLVYSRVGDYLEGGDRNSLLETFTRFFVPTGVDAQIVIAVPEEKQNMTLGKGKEPILGYSSVL
jgi:hypothetical protein